MENPFQNTLSKKLFIYIYIYKIKTKNINMVVANS